MILQCFEKQKHLGILMPSGQICDIVSDNGKDSVKNCIVLTKTAWLFGKLMVLSSAKEAVVGKKSLKIRSSFQFQPMLSE